MKRNGGVCVVTHVGDGGEDPEGVGAHVLPFRVVVVEENVSIKAVT